MLAAAIRPAGVWARAHPSSARRASALRRRSAGGARRLNGAPSAHSGSLQGPARPAPAADGNVPADRHQRNSLARAGHQGSSAGRLHQVGGRRWYHGGTRYSVGAIFRPRMNELYRRQSELAGRASPHKAQTIHLRQVTARDQPQSNSGLMPAPITAGGTSPGIRSTPRTSWRPALQGSVQANQTLRPHEPLSP